MGQNQSEVSFIQGFYNMYVVKPSSGANRLVWGRINTEVSEVSFIQGFYDMYVCS